MSRPDVFAKPSPSSPLRRIPHGLVAAVYTPMDGQGNVLFDRVPAQMDFLIERGIEGVFACGSTGEGLSLCTGERKMLAERVIGAVDGRVPVLIHVGHNSVADASDLAAHAQASAADGIAAISPPFFRPESARSLVGFFEKIARAAPKTPFYYYHFPSRIPSDVRLEDILEEADGRIPTFAGVKYTHNDFGELARVRTAYAGRLSFLFGRDEHFLDALRHGCFDFVGSTYNYAAVIFRRLRAAFDQGDVREAERLQGLVDRMIALIDALPPFAGQKYLMKLSGFDCGDSRTPLMPLSAAQQAFARSEWAAIMEALG